MSRLRFRLPGSVRPIGEWLSILFPHVDRSERRRWVERGDVCVAGRAVDRGGYECAAGSWVEIRDVSIDGLGGNTSETGSEWFAWVDAPMASSGSLVLESEPQRGPSAREMRFVVEERRDGLARLALKGPPVAAAQICSALAGAGIPVVGDLERGGLAGPAGPALGSSRAAIEVVLSDDDPPWPQPSEPDRPLRLRVSEEAARAVSRGHPWVLADEASDPGEVYRPGTELFLESRSGRVLGWAWAEGDASLSARMSVWGDLNRKEVPSIESRIARALARRRLLLAPTAEEDATDCYRLIHGEADGLPGFFVDRLGPLLRVWVAGRATEGFRERALDALRRQLPTTPEGVPWTILELMHVRTSGRGVLFDRVRWLEGGIESLEAAGVERIGEGFWVREAGLRFSVDPGWDSPRRTRPGFGLFPDQRENRERVASFAGRGGRWLNLFAHTGAFSAALLSAGAEEVVSVDLSGPYLDRLEANLIANRDRGVDLARHRSLRGDGRRLVESMGASERFAGIVLDPPTAASAGRHFWSVRQDLEPLLRRCIERLDSGGVLLVTQNAQGAPLGLERLLERVATRAHRAVHEISPAPPSLDYPRLPGFPEGDAFEGAVIELRASA